MPRQSLFPPPFSSQSTLLFNVIYQNREKKGNRLKSVSLGCVSFKKKAVFENCKFRKRARNRQPIYYCKDIPEPTSRPPAAHRAHTEPLPRQALFSAHKPTEPPHGLCLVRACFPPPSAHRALCYSMLYIKTVKKKEIGWIAFHFGCVSFKKNAVFKNCKFRKRARNRQPIYYCKDIPEPTSRPPASHRAHTEPLPRQGLFSAHQPTEPPHGLRPIRACFPPPSAHRALCYSMLYIKTVKKKEIGWIAFHLAASRFKKKRFSKIANLGNAPAIHNQNIIVKIFQSPPADHQLPTEPTQSLCPVRACLAPISPQSPHMVFAPSELVSPPHQPTEHFAIQCYISKPWKKRKSVE